MVRKGIFTPFHKLKGFERRIQQPEASTSHNAVEQENSNNLVLSSVEKAARSFSQAARARPTSKLLEPGEVPKLDAPTIPFRRLKKPLQLPKPPNSEGDLNTDSKKKKRRPLPGRKWTKRVSSEDRQLEGSGMSSSYLYGAQRIVIEYKKLRYWLFCVLLISIGFLASKRFAGLMVSLDS